MESLPPMAGEIHQLAEALQAAGSYVAAAQHRLKQNPHDHQVVGDLLDRATRELRRSFSAFHQLRHQHEPDT